MRSGGGLGPTGGPKLPSQSSGEASEGSELGGRAKVACGSRGSYFNSQKALLEGVLVIMSSPHYSKERPKREIERQKREVRKREREGAGDLSFCLCLPLWSRR